MNIEQFKQKITELSDVQDDSAGLFIGDKMFWIDAKDQKIKPPTNRPILCYCPGWNNSGYQVAYYSKGGFDYDESPNEDFHDYVEQWFVFLQAE